MDAVAVGLIITSVGLLALLVWEVAPWQLPRSRGEMSAVPGDDVDPDAGEAYCTDPDPVDEHAARAIAAVDEREQRRHFALWEDQMGRADR